MSFKLTSTAQRNLTQSSSFRFAETPKISIKDRLAALQQEGEQAWRRKLPPKNDIVASSPCLSSTSPPLKNKLVCSTSCEVNNQKATTPPDDETSLGVQSMRGDHEYSASTECIPRRSKAPNDHPRPVSIADRLSKLAESQERWVSRSPRDGQDAQKFTVAGKMRRMGVEGESPLATTKKPSIRPVTTIETRQDRKSPGAEAQAKDCNLPKMVKIPKMDEDLLFEQTFRRMRDSEKREGEVYAGEITNLVVNSDEVLPFVRKILPRRNNRGSTNPLKTRSVVIEMSDEYCEVRTGVAEFEKKRVEKERIVGQTHLAQEALAGLASKENFGQVSLRKGSSFHGTGVGDSHEPFKSLMLLHVKGRRVCQIRLVEPSFRSFNSGDCFVLVTPEVVYLWMGKFSNVIERAKAADLANQVVEKHDMGVRGTCRLITIDEEKQVSSRDSKLWSLLGLDEENSKNFAVKDPGPSEEDETFEAAMISTNIVYRLNEHDRLDRVPEYSGVALQCSVLQRSESLVFDFGSEMYTWSGKNVPSTRRKKALQLALDVWKKGFDYSDALMNPICPLDVDGEKSGSERPDWCLFCKVSQNLETALFKQKFTDWPDSGRMIKVKGNAIDMNDVKADLLVDLVPCEVEPMLRATPERSSLLLEGQHIGRGHKWEEMVDGIRWEHEMLTSDLEVWHVSESSHCRLDPSSFGQFHSGDTYVIRWRYSANQITRNLKGEVSKRDTTTGRNRCAYFFWQGVDSSVTEKGASALMTVELNQDNGPHVRLVQGKEPSCFLGLFAANPMFEYLGKRCSIHKSIPTSDIRFSKFQPTNSTDSSSPPHSPKLSRQPDCSRRLFVLRNELPEDSFFLEVPAVATSFRSRTSFLLADVGSEVEPPRLTVWHGCTSPRCVRKRICEMCRILVEERCPAELGLKNKPQNFEEVEEGFEPESFLGCFGGDLSRRPYFSLVDDPRPATHTPRLFHFTRTSGVFEAEEIHNPASNHLAVPSPFPFHQSDVYAVPQPGLFLLDNDHEVFLWQGWWPTSPEDCPNVQTGSASSSFACARKCAMRTAINYCKAKNLSSSQCYLVHAGCEPEQFTCLFPTWSVSEEAVLHAEQNNLGSATLESVSKALDKLNRSTYSWSELQARPLPDGVDPLKLETYLDDNEFQSVMGLPRVDFVELPQWKQTNLKRSSGLF